MRKKLLFILAALLPANLALAVLVYSQTFWQNSHDPFDAEVAGILSKRTLLEAVDHEDADVRIMAIESVKKDKVFTPEVIAVLSKGLRDKHGGVRRCAGERLFKAGIPGIHELTKALKHPQAEIRISAAQVLARPPISKAQGEYESATWRVSLAASALKEALEDQNEKVRTAAKAALAAIERGK